MWVQINEVTSLSELSPHTAEVQPAAVPQAPELREHQTPPAGNQQVP